MAYFATAPLSVIDLPADERHRGLARSGPPRCIILHHTAGTDSRSWLSRTSEPPASIHRLIFKDGRIFKIVPDDVVALHVGFSRIGNDTAINPDALGIELENLGTGSDPYPEAQVRAAAQQVAEWWGRYGYLPILPHAWVDTRGKADPRGFPWQRFYELLTAELRQALAPAAPPLPSDGPTADSPILAPPSAPAEQAIAFILHYGSAYSDDSVRVIVGHYWRFAPPAGVDPVLAIAQCIHETSEFHPSSGKWRPLSSWWALRPRRNPAGIGVTGMTQATEPEDKTAWAWDEQEGVWRHGLSFPSWEVAVRAQLGRLLAYALRDEQMSAAQRALCQEALAHRPLPADLRGTAPTLKQLGAKHNPTGRGWARPGEFYGQRIAEIARAISEVRT